MRIDRETADSFVSKLIVGDVGSILDDDIEEFVAVTPLTPETLSREIALLFDTEPVENEPIFDETNAAILELMDFESQRKTYLLEKKDEGMTMEDAKEAYDFAKAALVKKHLPQSDEEE